MNDETTSIDVQIDYTFSSSIDIARNHHNNNDTPPTTLKSKLKENVIHSKLWTLLTSTTFKKSCRPTVSVLLASLISLVFSLFLQFLYQDSTSGHTLWTEQPLGERIHTFVF
jgi:hypothetical protein